MVKNNQNNSVSILVVHAYIIIAIMLFMSLYALYALTGEESFMLKNRCAHKVISYEDDVEIGGENMKAYLLFDY